MTGDPLRLEITLSSPGEWRVVERSHAAAESVSRVAYSESELTDMLSEIQRCLLDANTSMEAQRARLRRLGGRLAEITLPVMLREKVAVTRESVEFFLDDASVLLPVELFPNGDTVLAEALPVSRHWFCENAVSFAGNSSGGTRHILIVADPAENLSGAQNEGEALLRKLRSQGKGWNCRFLGRAVTGAELARELPDTDVLHLAAHYVMGESELSSGIVLTDGLWMPSLSSHTPHVVFANCCRAGLPSGSNGELSLVGRFLRQGTRHIIAPFLPASDAMGNLFASAFYQSFFSGKPVAIAVWEARKAIGPAGWIYWHFGALPVPLHPGKRSRYHLPAYVIIALACALMLGYSYDWSRSNPGVRDSPPLDESQNNDIAESENTELSLDTRQIGKYGTSDFRKTELPEIPAVKDRYGELKDYLAQKSARGWPYSPETTQIIRMAVASGDIYALQLFLDNGWPIDRRDESSLGMPLLMHACMQQQRGIARMLLEQGADPNVKDWDGDTGMHVAAFYGDIETMRLLHEFGGDVNAVNRQGRTPSHSAVFSQNTETLQWLEKSGANVNDPAREWSTPLRSASKENFKNTVERSNAEQNQSVMNPKSLVRNSVTESGTPSSTGENREILRLAPDIDRDF